MSADIENASLTLLCDMQSGLRDALNSLARRESNGLMDHFLVFLSAHINRAAEGYISLRRSARVDASKLLIRPGIEAMIRILAVQKHPELLFRIAFTERREDRKWIRPCAIQAGQDYDSQDQRQWDDFKREYRTHFPQHVLEETENSLFDTAKKAGMEGYYNSHYRLYCRFTHAALGATVGDLNYSDSEDNRTMALCVCCGLEAVASAGGDAPTLSSLRKRLSNLDTPTGTAHENPHS